MSLGPEEIIHLHQSGYPDGIPLTVAHRDTVANLLELPDYSAIVEELDQDINTPKNGTKLWQSTDVA